MTMKLLTLLKWIDSKGQEQNLRIKNEISFKWRDVGDLLGVKSSRLEAIDSNRRGNVELCCRDVLQDWLQMEEPSYPVNWDGLIELLKDLQFNNMARKLKEALLCIRSSN